MFRVDDEGRCGEVAEHEEVYHQGILFFIIPHHEQNITTAWYSLGLHDGIFLLWTRSCGHAVCGFVDQR